MKRLGIAVLSVLLMFTAAEAKPRKAKSADATKAAATEKKSDKSADKSAAKADINTSSEADLEAVKGIGPATAKKIMANRPYASIDDLKKAGLSTAKIDQLRGSLTVSAAASAPAATSTKGSSSASTSKPSTSSSSGSSAPASSTSSSSSSKPSMWERLRGKKADSNAQPATSTSGTSSSSGANTSSGAATTQSTSAANKPQAPGGGDGKVWVNKDTKVFHREGDRWYGKTKNGEYMTEKDAIAQGYRPVKEREKKQ